MTNRERAMAVLRYRPYDRLPVVHFGFWREALAKWASEGHLTEEEALNWADGNVIDTAISAKLGFDFNWYTTFRPRLMLHPPFPSRIVKELPDGTRHKLNWEGVIVMDFPGSTSIPAEVDHTLKDRASWEKHYKWRFQWSAERLSTGQVRCDDVMCPFDDGGCEFLQREDREFPCGLHCGSLYGQIRNILGLERACYLMVDDEPLFDEIVETVAELSYQGVKAALASGARFDFGHFWEDICFKNGPLISPGLFAEKIGPQYRRITDLLRSYGIDLVSVDCDGAIDSLIPTWIANGVNIMFPIEVGTWGADIRPWREKYGPELRGVGGMNKVAFAKDRAAIDAEIERLKPLVELGGYIPCPDHRIAPDARWDLVRYYCDQMRAAFD